MICGRCGTEHNAPDQICPRCFYGRPKEKKKMPRRLKWGLGIGAPLLAALVALAIIFLPRMMRSDDAWLDGIWQGEDLALILSAENHSFQLINGENVLYGEYRVEEGELWLAADDGNHYFYSYQIKDPNTITVSFADGLYIVRETLSRMGVEQPEEEQEETGPEFIIE